MLIKIETKYNYDNQYDIYYWTLYDGPDGIDEYTGECNSLIECFQQILEHRQFNKLGYM